MNIPSLCLWLGWVGVLAVCLMDVSTALIIPCRHTCQQEYLAQTYMLNVAGLHYVTWSGVLQYWY